MAGGPGQKVTYLAAVGSRCRDGGRPRPPHAVVKPPLQVGACRVKSRTPDVQGLKAQETPHAVSWGAQAGYHVLRDNGSRVGGGRACLVEKCPVDHHSRAAVEIPAFSLAVAAMSSRLHPNLSHITSPLHSSSGRTVLPHPRPSTPCINEPSMAAWRSEEDLRDIPWATPHRAARQRFPPKISHHDMPI